MNLFQKALLHPKYNENCCVDKCNNKANYVSDFGGPIPNIKYYCIEHEFIGKSLEHIQSLRNKKAYCEGQVKAAIEMKIKAEKALKDVENELREWNNE